ncbi:MULTISPECIES: c-type cytochrome [unclassified Marinobacter]|uniref:c-type cytochrome n=1 Tax=unclassified Marinobacter TaxID=83889 RepID=UPI000BF27510|nr:MULTISPECIES: cytochrome c [unclassified Marinobacter]PFG08754.1 cytochrome c553 [Marinobacter sp. LV10MA510-1]PFG54636.1 cytochrome c553 [Marinobacter sp. LV10R520-4]
MSAIRSKVISFAVAGLALPVALATFSASASGDGQWKGGEDVYQKVCGHCHETKGDIGPVLAGRSLPPAYISYRVRNGYLAMPAFPASFIDDASLQQVSDYIQQLPAPDQEQK